MKKIYAILVAALIATAFTAHADVELHHVFPTAKMTKKVKTPAAKISRHASKAPSRVAPANDPLHPSQWEEWGTGTYTDDILTSFSFTEGIEPCTYEVRVQRDLANPGVYRIIDPWANYPQKDAIEEQDIELTLGDEVYITLDARKPEFVRLLRSPLGMADWGGPTEVIGYSEAEGIDEDIEEEQLDSHGTFTDGVIRFTEVHSIGIIQADETEEDGDYIYNANDNGAFALYLPGAEAPIDYSNITIYKTEPFCPDASGKYHVELGGDNRIASLKYLIVESIGDDTVEKLEAEGTVAHMGDIIEIDVTGTNRVVYLVVGAYDDNGEMQYALYGEYTAPDGDSEEWQPIGRAKLTEGFLSCLSLSPFTSETFEVEVEENVYLHNYYRIKNPYNSWAQSAPYSVGHDHNHYIYINAYYPEDVNVEYSPVGLDVSVFGELALSSDYYTMVQEYGHDLLAQYDIHSGGTLENGVISFNHRNDIRVLCYGVGKWFYTNRLVNPEYDEEEAAGNDNYDVEPYIAGPFRLDLRGTSGLSLVRTDASEEPETYFNLQGQPIDQASAKGLVIRVQGTHAEKVVLRRHRY